MAEENKKKTPPTEVLDDDFDDEDEIDDEDLDDDEDEDIDDVDDDKVKKSKKGDKKGHDDDEDDDADEDEEEDEDEDEDDEKSKKSKEEQDKAERARQAEARRKREAKEREAREKEIERKAYLKGKLEATKVNTFTEEPIEDEYDLFIFETQKQLEKEGKDPISDLPKRLADINRQSAKKATEEADKKRQLDEQIDKEFSEFKDKYPSVKIPELLADPDFKDYADGRLGKGGKTLTQLYESFQNLKKKFGGSEEEEEDDGKKSPPSPNGGRKTTKTSYSKMSREAKIKELRRQGLIN